MLVENTSLFVLLLLLDTGEDGIYPSPVDK